MEKTKMNQRERLFYLNKIAEKEAEKAAIIAEKDEVIHYYQRAAELATRSKHRALNSKSERRKDLMAYGAAVIFVVVAVWFAVMALHEFSLWAGGS